MKNSHRSMWELPWDSLLNTMTIVELHGKFIWKSAITSIEYYGFHMNFQWNTMTFHINYIGLPWKNHDKSLQGKHLTAKLLTAASRGNNIQTT